MSTIDQDLMHTVPCRSHPAVRRKIIDKLTKTTGGAPAGYGPDVCRNGPNEAAIGPTSPQCSPGVVITARRL